MIRNRLKAVEQSSRAPAELLETHPLFFPAKVNFFLALFLCFVDTAGKVNMYERSVGAEVGGGLGHFVLSAAGAPEGR